jgi:hypothetical protein
MYNLSINCTSIKLKKCLQKLKAYVAYAWQHDAKGK